jgi:hypothetical protein
MASESRFKEWASQAKDFFNEQAWFQELKAKWEELDPNSRQYLKVGSIAGAALLAVILVISSLWSVRSLKNELSEKQDLLTLIQSGNDELRRLRDSNSSVAPSNSPTTGPWPAYIETLGVGAGIEKASLTIGDEKPGAAGDLAKETLLNLNLKHVSIKQLVRFAYGIETGGRPVKLRNLQIDTKSDPEGYMDATLSVSGFAWVTK